MPLAAHEPEGADFVTTRRYCSRQHPPKVMVMAVIGKPNAEHNFSGRISLKRISKQRPQATVSYNTDFCVSRTLFDTIQSGAWHEFYQPNDPTYNVSALLEDIHNTYELDDDILLCFRYNNYTRNDEGQMKRKKIYLKGTDLIQNKIITTKHNVSRQLTVSDLHLCRKVEAGTIIEEDVSCDSIYMEKIIPEIGEEIRVAYSWVSRETPIYLQLDNAGGHGTKDIIETYRARLLEEFNIILLHQPARSPETNALDLGFWMALQNRTEKKSFDMRISKNNVFTAVQEAWDEMPALTITKICDRIPKVLDLIVQDNGGNRLVQNNRGLMREPAEA